MGAQTIGNIPADIATDEEYSKIISEINMTGVESAYAYLVSEDGTMIYHPTADKIGQPVENTVLNRWYHSLRPELFRRMLLLNMNLMAESSMPDVR